MRWSPLTAALVAALAVAVVSVSPRSVSAQTSPQATFYGRGAPLQAGDKVAVLIGGVTCNTATVNGSLEWSVSVAPGASCLPTDGVAVAVTVNGNIATATPSPVWKVGGLPPDVANGYKLTLGNTPAPNATGTPVPGSSLISGSIPKSGGYGIVAVLQQVSIGDVVTATGCPSSSMALYATVGGSFITYVPGTTIAAVNALFLAQFPNGGVPTGTALIGKCS